MDTSGSVEKYDPARPPALATLQVNRCGKDGGLREWEGTGNKADQPKSGIHDESYLLYIILSEDGYYAAEN